MNKRYLQFTCLMSATVTAFLMHPADAHTLPGHGVISAAAADQSAPDFPSGGWLLMAVWSDSRANVTGRYEGETSQSIYGLRQSAEGTALDAVPFTHEVGESV